MHRVAPCQRDRAQGIVVAAVGALKVCHLSP
jgi:hypothetical protein